LYFLTEIVILAGVGQAIGDIYRRVGTRDGTDKKISLQGAIGDRGFKRARPFPKTKDREMQEVVSKARSSKGKGGRERIAQDFWDHRRGCGGETITGEIHERPRTEVG